MGLKILIVDDETLARSRLRTLLGDCDEPCVDVIDEADNAVQAMGLVRSGDFDLVLIDIHMPGVDGLALAKALRQLPTGPHFIFVTATAKHAVQAFELEAVDYLTKPVRLKRLQQALQKVDRLLAHPVLNEVNGAVECLVIQDRGRCERVPLTDVVYLKAELKYVTLRTVEREHIFSGTLSDLEQKYAHLFVRVHRNALVARACVRSVERVVDPVEGDGWVVQLDGMEKPLPVSRRVFPAVRKALMG
jgi:two-component system response regulator AlgR